MSKEATLRPMGLIHKVSSVEPHQIVLIMGLLSRLIDLFSDRRRRQSASDRVVALREAVLDKLIQLQTQMQRADSPAAKNNIEQQIRALLSLVAED